jgi:radical SAM family RiPP maturation amino acid epimerase
MNTPQPVNLDFMGIPNSITFQKFNLDFLRGADAIWTIESSNPGILSNADISYLAHIKRFMERWDGDPDFRDRVSVEPFQNLSHYRIELNSDELLPLWESNFTDKLGEEHEIVIRWKRWQEIIREKKETLEENVYHSAIASFDNPNFQSWRNRQIARCSSEFNLSGQNAIVHFSVSLELNKGCSVGCPFCGVSAPRLSDIFFYDRDNAKLWRETLKTLKKVLHSAASVGFCYWATEPMDNPDYEKFCHDFYDILGIFPSTTTAIPLKDPTRTREFLKLSKNKKCYKDRFSILSLQMLDRVHQEFSAEELAFVKLQLQNKEANSTMARTGRSREKSLKQGEADIEFPDQGTIACTSGFLFNMVDRSVKLISPCNANERWPNGYIVYDRGTFSNGKDLKILLEKMIEDNMSLTLKDDRPVSFRSDLKYESLADGFQLSTKFKTYQFTHQPNLKYLGDLIHKNSKNVPEIVSNLKLLDVSSMFTSYYLNLMFEKGVLDELPLSIGQKLKK